MEFVKLGKRYLIKGSNGKVISEKEKLELENKELTLKDVNCSCQKKIEKVAKNNKRLKELSEKDYKEVKNIVKFKNEIETALQDKENADGIIEETVSTD